MARYGTTYLLFIAFFILNGVFLPIMPGSSARAGDLSSRNPGNISADNQEELPLSYEENSSIWKAVNDRTNLVSQVNTYYAYSEQKDGGSIDGGGINLLLAPNFIINKNSLFICMYNGSYYKKLDFYSDQVGPRAKTESTAHTLTPMVRIGLDDQSKYSITPSIFHTQTYNIDVEDGDWEDGLYNYRDTGVGLSFRAKEFGDNKARGIFNLGLQYYQRKYPNYDSLLDLATGNALEEDERDYQGILLRAGYDLARASGFSWGAGYYYLAKNLDGKKIVQSNGVLTENQEQKDNLIGVDLRLSYVPSKLNQLRLGLDLSGSFNRSNQNYYDGGADDFPIVSDDRFLGQFYDYNAYRVASHISFSFTGIPMTARVSYAYKDTEYTGRLAQSVSGNYKDEKQAEEQNEIDAEFRYNFFKQWNAYLRYQYLKVDSNNDDESVYLYDHEVNTYSAGISFSY